MTTYYVDSAGSNTAPYDTWAKAATALATIAALDAAGDTVYVANSHAETGASISWNWAGTATSPTRIICADKTSGAPPVTIASSATVTGSSGDLTLSASGSGFVYFYGITFIASAGDILCGSNTGNVYHNCSFQPAGGHAIAVSNTNNGTCFFWDCSVKFSNASSGFVLASGEGPSGFEWRGGSLLAGGTSPTALFKWQIAGSALVEDVDLSNASASINLVNSAFSGIQMLFRNIKLPASWSGSVNSGTTGAGSRFTLQAVDSTGIVYTLNDNSRFGSVRNETTLVRTGGASDGTTVLSWKMVSLAASGVFPLGALTSGDIIVWNTTTAASKTVTLEFLHDSVTGLKDDEIWMELSYYGASGNPQGSRVSSAKTNVLATGATLATSSETWTTTGMTNPNKQKMSVTFTPQLAGFFVARVKLAKASKTVYVDPKLTVT